jgi:hypothetical protein
MRLGIAYSNFILGWELIFVHYQWFGDLTGTVVLLVEISPTGCSNYFLDPWSQLSASLPSTIQSHRWWPNAQHLCERDVLSFELNVSDFMIKPIASLDMWCLRKEEFLTTVNVKVSDCQSKTFSTTHSLMILYSTTALWNSAKEAIIALYSTDVYHWSHCLCQSLALSFLLV